MVVLLVAALVVFGPERLPEIAAQLGRGLRQLRGMLDGMSAEVRSGLGPEIAELDLKTLHPKNLLASLMADESPAVAPQLAQAVTPLPVSAAQDLSGAPLAPDLATPPEATDTTIERPLYAVAFEIPTGTDAMTLLRNPVDVSDLVAPWDEPAAAP